MRRFFLICLLPVCALWGLVAAGQVGTVAPSTLIQERAAVSTASPPPVWVNTPSKIYHYAGSRWYGRTRQGKYLSETEALAEGDRAARNEHHPKASPPPVVATAVPSPPVVAPAASPSLDIPVVESVATSPSAELLSTCITAIATQSDPAKLATLGSRAVNPRLKRIMYYLAQARATGADPSEVIEQVQKANGSIGTPRAPLVKASLLRNLKICDGLGLLTTGNMSGLRRGNAPTVTRGPYTGQKAEVDHIVPLAQAPELGNELANLEMLPATLNRAKSDKVGERQLALAKKFHDAGLISDARLAVVQGRFRPAGTEKYELRDE